MNDDKTKLSPNINRTPDGENNDKKTRLAVKSIEHPPSSNSTSADFLSSHQPGDRTLTTGDILKNRFVLENVVAKGGMGIVYKARDLRKEEARDKDPYVAIKVLSEEFKRHPDSLISLQRETKKAQLLAHPNVVTVHDFDRDGSQVYMTMEYLEGQSLEKIISNKRNTGLHKDEALTIIKSMAHGLSYAHQKRIVHSDFKPANVFYTNDKVIKILDFGIARALKKRTDTPAQDETIFDPGKLGALTPTYASCEMLEHKEPDPRDDIYAMACVSYELLTGRHPYNRLTALQARENKLQPKPIKILNKCQWKAIKHALALDKEIRTNSIEEFLDQLSSSRWSFLKSTKTLTGTIAVIFALTITVMLLLNQNKYTSIETPAEIEIEELPLNPALQPEVNNLLDIAESFLLFGRLTDPPGSNAFEAYKKVHELHPTNRKAHEGLTIIAEQYLEQAKNNIEKGDKIKASAYIDRGLLVRPEHKELLDLKNNLQ